MRLPKVISSFAKRSTLGTILELAGFCCLVVAAGRFNLTAGIAAAGVALIVIAAGIA